MGWDGREGKGGEGGREGEGDRMWRGPESGLPRGPCWLSAGLVIIIVEKTQLSRTSVSEQTFSMLECT